MRSQNAKPRGEDGEGERYTDVRAPSSAVPVPVLIKSAPRRSRPSASRSFLNPEKFSKLTDEELSEFIVRGGHKLPDTKYQAHSRTRLRGALA